jgi:hypothetical protein
MKRCPMARVSLERFIECLELAKVFDRRYPYMDQVEWLFDHWCFDNERAYYGQQPPFNPGFPGFPGGGL